MQYLYIKIKGVVMVRGSFLFVWGFALVMTGCAQETDLPKNSVPSEATTTLSSVDLVLTRLDIPNAPDDAVNEQGVLRVPVDRSSTDSELIDLEFFRFQRLPEARSDTPPLVILRGGPGYPGLGDAINNEAFYDRSLARYTRLTDVIIVGQRGFGTSGDLSCESVPRSSLQEVNNSAQSRDRYRRTAEMCRDKYLSEGRALRGYNVREMADDVAAVVRSLGYETVQLRGNSFGSFWGMAILRRHPDLISRAAFSALEGPDHTFDRPSAVKAALLMIAEAASQSDRYAERIPEEGLIAAYEAVIASADANPIDASFIDSETGERVTIYLDGDALRRFSIGVTTRPVFRYQMADWPDDLLKIIEGNFEDVAPRLARYMTGTDADSAAQEIIECSSGISASRRSAMENDPARHLLGLPVRFDTETCAIWDEAVVDMDRGDFRTDVRTVLIQGTWDISTPYEDAQTVRSYFSDHHFLTVEGGSHGSLWEAEEADPDFIDALNQWYVTGETTMLPTRITLPALNWNGEE